MAELSVQGVTVKFPFPPYDCQKDYMSRVMECLQQKKNGVLESPTGTGKTLCLLCATLAWRENFRDTISARKITERLKGADMFPESTLASWGNAATDGDSDTYYTDVPKIIYASRTHSQLAQVIGELKNTAYRPKVCVLGSREQLCIHPEVMRQESNHVKVHMCRAKVSTRSCTFYNNVEEKSTDRELVNSILDVEDLVKYGTKQRVCPYYLSRSLKQQADIIFMPYNYLLDPKSRRAHNIELSKAVVIFDEAHNVERTCEESTSFDLTPYDVASAITAVDRLLAEQAREVSHSETVSESFSSDSLSSGLKIDISTIAKIKQILLDLEAAIDSYDVPSDRGITKPGIFIYELLERAHLNYSTKTAVCEALEQITGYLAGQPGVFLNTSGLQKLADIIQLVFCGEPAERDRALLMQANTAHFKVHIHQDQASKKRSADPWATSAPKKQGNVLSYWCFSPGFSMQELVGQGVRCIILTSGTLSPLSSFTAEMRIDFPIRLENDHVIQRDQIFVSVVDCGPDGVQLTSAFDRRFLPENMASLGSTIANLSRVVPDGLLVFFPSFPLMEKTLEFWREKGQADRIEKLKPMFVEPKGKGTFTEVIEGYYNKVTNPDSKGGSFFAVCRGKASEGLDFADSYGRGVIITGLPFPPKMDPRVVLKMQFLDEMCRRKTPGVKYLTGQEWYRQQAFRAVNQAVGRVIRHKEDYGAIFLCDQRFKGPSAMAQLPKWVRPYVRTYSGFGNVVREVSQFFRVAQKMRPPVERKPPVRTVAPQCSADSGLGPSSQSSQSRHTRQAKAVDAHIPSLKRRRVGDITEANGLPKICIKYESGGQESHRRPTSLLDALEQQQASEANEETMAGEEKAARLSTLSLQYDKRIEEELRGGKRKIKVVQQQKSVSEAWEHCKASRARSFLSEMKRSLSHVTFDQMVQALQSYKKSDQLGTLLRETAALAEDRNTHSLLRGFYQFIRPHHKQQFDEQVRQLTGQGCGFKPEHALSKDHKITLLEQAETCEGLTSSNNLLDTQQLNHGADHLRPDTASSSSAPAACSQLNSQLLNQGQEQLTRQGLTQSSVAAPKPDFHVTFLADVKTALGPEGSAQLFQAVRSYKLTDDYDQLVSTVVSLLTERDELFPLLIRFGMFIRPHHKTQYKELLDSLIGPNSGPDPGPDPDTGPDPGLGPENVSDPNQPSSVHASPAVKKQSKISTFFPNSQRK